MEVKINKEIRNYTESMFFGLSLRQFVFSFLAMAVAVTLFFLLRGHLKMETVSWVCVLSAAPFAAMGFVKYHGMTAEHFFWAWIKSELLEPHMLCASHSNNLYYNALENHLKMKYKEVRNRHEETDADTL